MKILFSVFRYHTNMVSMVRALQDAGHEVLILVVAQEPYEDRHEGLVQFINQKAPIEPQVFSVFESYNPDAVVVRNALNEGVALVVAKVSKARKTKCVSYEQKACYVSNPLKALCIGLSHAIKQIRHGLPVVEISPKRGSDKGYPVPFRKYFLFPMTERSDVKNRSYCPDGTVRVTAIGKLGVSRKRLDWVIDALDKSNGTVKVVLAGAADLDRYPRQRNRDYYNKIYTKAYAVGQDKTIEIRENVPFSEMPKIYADTDIFVLPSRGETFGISPLEAMSYGCAVICADDNGSSPYIQHDYDGLIFKALHYFDFEKKLCALVVCKDQVRRLGQAAAGTVRKNHGYSQFVTRFMYCVGCTDSKH